MEMLLGAIISLVGGMGLGYLFFWGLWKTISSFTAVKNPYLWMFASFIVRTVIVVLGFYLMLQFHWQFAALGLVGFLLSRMILVRKFSKVEIIERTEK